MRALLLGLILTTACRSGEKVDDNNANVDTGALSSVDADGDGFSADEDCDDNDASVNGGAVEVCNGIDDNCDGEIDEGVSSTYYSDVDGDGFGDPASAVEACSQPAEAVTSGTDCDDTDPRVFPSANELCNGVDDDCDGEIDNGLMSDWYPDADGDGYGDPAGVEQRCDEPSDMVQVGTDCDDTTAAANPSAVEFCDEIDNDCDGLVDEDVTTTYWVDGDGDGFGDATRTTNACSLPPGYAEDPGDCDDTDLAVNPDATELCNSIDDDCDGTIDEDDAADATTWWRDADSDGVGVSSTTAVACAQPSGFVSASAQEDCDDGNATTYPGSTEYCDGEDDDCDGTVDEADAADATTWWLDADSDNYGGSTLSLVQCNQPAGYVANATDCDDLDGAINPGASEVCNDEDDDCDGATDEGLATSTWYLDDDEDGYGSSSTSQVDCGQPSGYVANASDCDDTNDDINPGEQEICNSIDDDCDGATDDADSDIVGQDTWYADADNDGYGDSGVTTSACDEPTGYTDDSNDCDDTDTNINPGASERCNDEDDDCDTVIDEGVLGTGSSCPAEDCSEILADDPSASSGTYYLDVGGASTAYSCDMTTDGGGWTLVGNNVRVWGTSYDTSYYNAEGFTWTEVFFEYASGSVHAHCTYPGSLTGCNNLGFQFGSQSWGVAQNWGSSLCGMSTTSYTSNTSYIGGYDFVIDDSASSRTIRLGTLEGIAGCTTSDNPGNAYVDIWVRQ